MVIMLNNEWHYVSIIYLDINQIVNAIIITLISWPIFVICYYVKLFVIMFCYYVMLLWYCVMLFVMLLWYYVMLFVMLFVIMLCYLLLCYVIMILWYYVYLLFSWSFYHCIYFLLLIFISAKRQLEASLQGNEFLQAEFQKLKVINENLFREKTSCEEKIASMF
jgi:hypothetical protein